MHQYDAVQQWQGQLRASAASLVNDTQRADRWDVAAPSMDYYWRAPTLTTPSTRPLRAEPARSSSAVACSENCYFCLYSFIVGFLPSTPTRVQNRRANVGPCEVRIRVKLNKMTVERSRTSTHFLGQRFSPAALLTAEVTSLSQFLSVWR